MGAIEEAGTVQSSVAVTAAVASNDSYQGADAVVAEGLRTSYGAIVAVDGISFTVRRGEVFGLLGPNGAGKTTTIEILEGLRQADAGRVAVCGLDPITSGAALKERIGIALQRSELYPKLAVREVLRLFGTFYARAVPPDDLITLVDLGEKRGSLVKTLSGGQKQRLAVALALVNDPEVLFLDEPTAGLDPQARRGLWDVIAQLRGAGKTILLTTHYMEEAEQLCDRVAIVDHGRIIALDGPDALVDRYLNEETIVFKTAAAPDPDALRLLPAVCDVILTPLPGQPEWHTVALRSADAQASLRALLNMAGAEAQALRELRVQRATLEDVFLQLTGRSIRE
jgi:ABC-2 type transport system ATP-binding protein